MKIKLVILDIDGVLTDGSKIYGQDGLCHYKRYCDKDFTAIKKLMACGVSVCFLSGDSSVNLSMAQNRNIDFYLSKNLDKASFVDEFKQKYKCSSEEMLYIGDDIFDVSLLKIVGYPVCPSDACQEVKDCSELILNSKGGDNVIMELFDHLQGIFIDKLDMNKFLKLDEKQKF
jgi:3-deoxy-D-manno-octulosonate 8-phosphate phosphatase (KDO 8-P phosphatase)